MPLYDCMLLLKPHVKKEPLIDLVAKIGKHVYRRNGVVTDMKSFGTVQLGYGIKKLDGRYYQGQLMQLTMMTPPSFNSELHYLTKEDRLLRWLLVKHRDVQLGAWSEDGHGGANPMRDDFRNYRIELHDPEEGGGVFSRGSSDDDEDDDDEEEEEYEGDGKEG